MLVATIGDDIGADGWRVGSVFGTETALLQRYRVSRAVFREAVRLLEYHSIAHMRRGPGGGLVIAEPAAQASIDTIALYLKYRDPSREDLRCARDAIEIDNVAKVVKRLAEPQVAAFVASRRSGLPDDSRQTPDHVRRAIAEEFDFHVGLAQLAGNAPLDLFLRIIVELFRRHRTCATDLVGRARGAPRAPADRRRGRGRRPERRQLSAAPSSGRRRLLVAVARKCDLLRRIARAGLGYWNRGRRRPAQQGVGPSDRKRERGSDGR